jgi:hypothetical protein
MLKYSNSIRTKKLTTDDTGDEDSAARVVSFT